MCGEKVVEYTHRAGVESDVEAPGQQNRASHRRTSRRGGFAIWVTRK